MSEIISQKDIDELMGNIQSETTEEIVDNRGKIISKKSNVYQHKENKNIRFKFLYKSPVIKREEIIFNPKSNEDVSGKIIVRSLEEYNNYIRRI